MVYIPSGDVGYLPAATIEMRQQLASEFPDWNFTFSSEGLSGTMTIDHYRPGIIGGTGGAEISATYTRATNDPVLSNLVFIQMVSTSDPIGGSTSPYIDPRPNDDSLPFYWTTSEMAQNTDVGAGTILFTDFSRRPPPPNPDFIPGWDTYWQGQLMLAAWSGGASKDVTIYDGIAWSWYIDVFPPLPGGMSIPGFSGNFGRGSFIAAESSDQPLLAIGGLAVLSFRMRRLPREFGKDHRDADVMPHQSPLLGLDRTSTGRRC